MDPWLDTFALTNFQRSMDTAHDLKTPLNVAVLNLELLRIRVAKLCGENDEKVISYARSIELELRRMARIFDTFFILSTPPKGEGDPQPVTVGPIVAEAAAAMGFASPTSGDVSVTGHESRIRQAVRMFFEGVSKILKPETRHASVESDDRFHVVITGELVAADFDASKLFKLYYSDAAGNPELSLAGARLIAETYGGELTILESDKVSLRLSFPRDKT